MMRSTFLGALTMAALVSLVRPSAAQTSAGTEAALRLADRELFETAPSAGWLLSPGWTRAAFGQGFALKVAAAQAGLNSVAQARGNFGDVVIEGQFTFTGAAGSAQLLARVSAAGSYVAQLDTSGKVTLEKRDSEGTAISSWSAAAEPQAVPGSARTMQLSAMGGALRVTVDGIDVLTAADPAALPPGANQIGAVFATTDGALIFDNYAVWVPSDEVAPPASTAPAESSMALQSAPVEPQFAPGNDQFADRNVATGGRFSTSGNNSTASEEGGEPAPAAALDITKTVWYEFTPPASRQYLLTTFGSSFDTVLAVYTGPAAIFGSLTEVASSDNVTGSLQAQLTLPLDSTKTYYIQLGSRKGSGDFEFRIVDPADVAVPSTPAISESAPTAPSAPVADKGATNRLQPVLAWAPRPSITPYAYLAEVSNTPSFSSFVSSGVIEEPTRFWEVAPALNPPNPPSGEKYYWRVAALNFLGQTSTFSPAYTFTLDTQPPEPPALISPVVNGVADTLRPTFTWQPVADATGYHFRITTNFSLTTVQSPANDVDVATASFTPSADLPQGEYWYGAMARDAAGNWSPYGEKRHFIVNVSKTPAKGANVFPQGTSTTADVVLTWTEVPGATYTLQVATDSSFSVLDEYGPLSTASYTLTGRPFGTYYWRVAVNGAYPSQSLARSFTVTPPLPEAPMIQTPGLSGALADKAITNDVSPSFDWTVPANWVPLPQFQSLTYEFQLATDSSFTQEVLHRTGLPVAEYVWDQADLPPTPGTTYYWRVRAMTNLQLPGAYSKTFTFTLDTQPPTSPVVTSPALTPPLTRVLAGQRPVIKWQPVDGAVRYHVRIATDLNGTSWSPENDAIVESTSFTPPAALSLGDYFFFVESQDAAGNWSGFTTAQLPFQVNLARTPADAAILVAKAPANSLDVVFTWEPMQGATTYRLEVALDGDTSFTGSVSGFDVTGTTRTVNLPTAGSAIRYWRVYRTGTTPPPSYFSSFAILGTAPNGPAGVAPVQDDVITTQTPVVLSWTKASVALDSGVYTYQVQLATDRKFSQVLEEGPPSASNATTYQPVIPLPPGTYYWRVRETYMPSGLISPYSETYRFTIVDASATIPVLTTPLANTILSTSRPTLKWKPVALSTGYRVRIDDDVNGSGPAVVEVELNKTTFTPTTDLPQGEYWFRVESKDPQGDWSGFGEMRRFVLNYSKSPANEGAIVAKAPAYTANVVLKWSKMLAPTSANTQRVQIDNNSDFSSPISTSPILSPSTSTYTFTNRPVGTYYWRVVVTGHATPPTSLAYRFIVTPPLPVAPVIENPIPALTNDTTPRFDWKVPANWVNPPPGGSLSYQLQVATDKKFTQLIGSTVAIPSDTFYDWPSDLPPGATYYWRVRAITNLNVPGAFSKVSAFTVDTTDPSVPILKAPADLTVTTSARPAFSWTKAANGATRYRFELDDDTSFTAPPVRTATGTKTSYTPAQPLPQGIYYWHVYALDAAGNETDATDYRTLTVDYRTAPAEGAEITATASAGLPVRFAWVGPKGAPKGTNYTIEIDDDLDGIADLGLPSVTTLSTLSTALPPGYYRYRLVVNNGFGTSDWRPFTILPP